MGYDASVGGCVYLRPLDENEKSDICKKLTEAFCCNRVPCYTKWPELCGPLSGSADICVTEAEDGVEINISGYDRYNDEEWYLLYKILNPYIDFSKDNSFEFTGEDDTTWRFRYTVNGVEEDNGSVVYDNEIPFAVCIRESCVRDAQFRTFFPEESGEEDDNDDFYDEGAWADCSGPIFIKMIKAASEEAAIKMVAKDEGYDTSVLVAFCCQ